MRYRVLIADDSVTMQRVLEIALATEQAELHLAERGDEALEAVLALRPDVVLAAAALPGLDGYALCRQMRQDARLASIPLVLLCSAQRPYQSELGTAAGVSGHLTKPVVAHKLVAQIQALLRAAPPAPPSLPGEPAPGGPTHPAPMAVAARQPAPGAAPGGPPQAAATAPVPAASAAGHASPQPMPTPQAPAQRPPAPAPLPSFALPPLPNWDRPPAAAAPAATQKMAQAVAQALAQWAPTLDQQAFRRRIDEVVEREVVAILWQVIPKLAEEQLQKVATALPPADARGSSGAAVPAPLAPQGSERRCID